MARILLVEDTPAVLNLLAEVLGDKGHTVHAVSTVEEGMTKLDGDGAIDLLVSDYELFGRTALELIAHVRKRHLPTRILVISGNFVGDPALASRVLESGADLVLEKPFELGRFNEAVQTMLPPGDQNGE